MAPGPSWNREACHRASAPIWAIQRFPVDLERVASPLDVDTAYNFGAEVEYETHRVVIQSREQSEASSAITWSGQR